MSHATLAPEIIGDSPAIQHVRALIERVASSTLPVLIQGPTGAGKELVAQSLHARSGRPGRFVAFNVCAISETMFEDALFGHVRGAFTGATSDTLGYLAEADRGTVFLDEIGGLPLPLQAKLLRVLETNEFRPIGAHADRMSAFRTITATNEPLDALVAESRFRPDLAHRLSGMVIDVPPLRHRIDDVPALARHFLHGAASRGDVRLTVGAIRALQSHDWPGNVRELRLAIERAVALCDRLVVGREQIQMALQHGAGTRPTPVADEFARRRLVDVLESVGWDTALAAERLGVHRVTVYRRMHRLGIPLGPAGGGRGASGRPFAPSGANLRLFAANRRKSEE